MDGAGRLARSRFEAGGGQQEFNPTRRRHSRIGGKIIPAGQVVPEPGRCGFGGDRSGNDRVAGGEDGKLTHFRI